MSSRMRVTKGHSGHRRGHHALKTPRLSKCSNCGGYFQRHRVCQECGFYKGKKILDLKKTKEVTTKKKKEVSSSSNSTSPKATKNSTSKKTVKK